MRPYDGTCPVCEQLVEASASFVDQKFIDGKNYTVVCHTCCCVPRGCDAEGNQTYHPGFLHNVEEMLIYGFDKISANISIKAVKMAIKKAKLSTKCDFVPLNVLQPIDHPDRVDRTESAGVNLKCEFCGKLCSSTSGLTLHKKRCASA